MRHHEVLFLHVSDSFAMTAMGHGRASESLIYRADPKKKKPKKQISQLEACIQAIIR